MKICALTMVYRDYWALSQWYMHYGQLLGFDNLYILAHGRDDQIAKICPKAQITTIPRDNLDRFDWARGNILNQFQATLSETYDWVIRTDADELVCLDPNHYSSFEALLSKRWGPAIFALGLEVVERDGETAIPMNVPALKQRSAAKFSGHYSKAWVVKNDTRLVRHGVDVGKRRAHRVNFSMPQGVYLAHLKYADTTALAKANAHRIEVATTDGKSMPGAAWAKPFEKDAKFYKAFASGPQVAWDAAVKEAYEAVSIDPIRTPKTGIVRARSLRFQNTTILPDWFKTQGED